MLKQHVYWIVLGLSVASCASEWKIQGGPKECVQMCQGWNMELAGMVGVGNQDPSGPGATACVCQVRSAKSATSGGEVQVGAVGTAASASAVIVALEEEKRREQQQQQQLQRVR